MFLAMWSFAPLKGMKSILEACKMMYVVEAGSSEVLHPSNFPPLSQASNFMATYNAILFLLSSRNVDHSPTKA